MLARATFSDRMLENKRPSSNMQLQKYGCPYGNVLSHPLTVDCNFISMLIFVCVGKFTAGLAFHITRITPFFFLHPFTDL